MKENGSLFLGTTLLILFYIVLLSFCVELFRTPERFLSNQMSVMLSHLHHISCYILCSIASFKLLFDCRRFIPRSEEVRG